METYLESRAREVADFVAKHPRSDATTIKWEVDLSEETFRAALQLIRRRMSNSHHALISRPIGRKSVYLWSSDPEEITEWLEQQLAIIDGGLQTVLNISAVAVTLSEPFSPIGRTARVIEKMFRRTLEDIKDSDVFDDAADRHVG